ncbi:kinase-like domain-containing protein [Chytriomyces sp. MP71]|nr:kinase-like domain-containing protein [Chytriomyces sp. MP71]
MPPRRLNGNTQTSITERLQDILDAIVAFFQSLVTKYGKSEVFRVRNRRFTVLRSLGEGGFSYVHLVKETTSGIAATASELYALKQIRVQLPEQEQRLRAEISAHGAVNSPFVLKLVDSVILRGADLRQRQNVSGMDLPVLAEGLLVLPYYGGGTVQDLIDGIPPGESLELKRILEIASDIAKGLLAFHKKNPPLAFRDLKPANILLELGSDRKAILMDLGSVAPARVNINSRREAVALQELCAETVTAPFRAPELFDPSSDASIDERTDVWAFGCTIWNMAYQTPPFDGSMTAAVGGQLLFPPRDAHGPALRTFLKDVLVTDIKKRLFMDQVLIRVENLLGSLSHA